MLNGTKETCGMRKLERTTWESHLHCGMVEGVKEGKKEYANMSLCSA